MLVSPKALNCYFIANCGTQEELGAAMAPSPIFAGAVVSAPPAIIRLEGPLEVSSNER